MRQLSPLAPLPPPGAAEVAVVSGRVADVIETTKSNTTLAATVGHRVWARGLEGTISRRPPAIRSTAISQKITA